MWSIPSVYIGADVVAGPKARAPVRAMANRLADIDLGAFATYVQQQRQQQLPIAEHETEILSGTIASIVELLRFLILKSGAAGRDISPTSTIDELWHQLLLFPVVYQTVCASITANKQLIDHDPNGARDPPQQRSERLQAAVEAYASAFGEPPSDNVWEVALPCSLITIRFDHDKFKICLRLPRKQSASELKDLLAQMIGVDPSDVALNWMNPVHDRDTPLRSFIEFHEVSCRVEIGSAVDGFIDHSPAAPFRAMQIFVITQTGRKIALDVLPKESVLEVKRSIRYHEGIPVDQQRLIFAGKSIDGLTLADWNIKNKCSLHVVLRLRGC